MAGHPKVQNDDETYGKRCLGTSLAPQRLWCRTRRTVARSTIQGPVFRVPALSPAPVCSETSKTHTVLGTAKESNSQRRPVKGAAAESPLYSCLAKRGNPLHKIVGKTCALTKGLSPKPQTQTSSGRCQPSINRIPQQSSKRRISRPVLLRQHPSTNQVTRTSMDTGTLIAAEPREEPDLHLRLDVQVRSPTKTHPPVKRAGRHAPVCRVVTTVPNWRPSSTMETQSS